MSLVIFTVYFSMWYLFAAFFFFYYFFLYLKDFVFCLMDIFLMSLFSKKGLLFPFWGFFYLGFQLYRIYFDCIYYLHSSGFVLSLLPLSFLWGVSYFYFVRTHNVCIVLSSILCFNFKSMLKYIWYLPLVHFPGFLQSSFGCIKLTLKLYLWIQNSLSSHIFKNVLI